MEDQATAGAFHRRPGSLRPSPAWSGCCGRTVPVQGARHPDRWIPTTIHLATDVRWALEHLGHFRIERRSSLLARLLDHLDRRSSASSMI